MYDKSSDRRIFRAEALVALREFIAGMTYAARSGIMRKTLRLQRETIRNLSTRTLRDAAGGTDPDLPAGVNSQRVSGVTQPCVASGPDCPDANTSFNISAESR
jgi:hypothetical protein